MLWENVADVIIKRMQCTSLKIVTYLNDSFILKGIDTRKSLELNLNACLDAFNQICGMVNIHINLEKSKAILFGRYNISK